MKQEREEFENSDEALLNPPESMTANPDQYVQSLHARLKQLLDCLVEKIQKKHDSLMLSQQQLTVYQETLKQKYGPIFQQMEGILQEKKLEYMTHLVDSLQENYRRVGLEKEALEKLERGFAADGVKARFKQVLEQQMALIKQHVDRQQALRDEQLKARQAAAKAKEAKEAE